ncbi:3-hydroxyacyl-CoA dehydrogenase [Marinovum sp. 2_MG-2023]|uniref:3-hydroxyacyl-CoA dehydrogenase n=1 Tax=unclassified Marinovum TaxID=2647166 RepID=UPI0026E30ACB|nr:MULTISPECIES: 3-hydroxyacyl-CoA dehydrogenase [unclassified Marinovum]MDO6732396.1 3-hydroxyacyl-CoA dehydrogenase [Marinovum sp. 2_MG-2023]MDO6781713.1 3-hydroxyacyl-CoA dehydrogenase [Marinovum sp. 1_MG-2023]
MTEMTPSPSKVAIVGIGLIGRAWANVFARAGWDVALWDENPEALAAAPALVRDSLFELTEHGLVQDPEAGAGRVRAASSLEDAVGDVDFIQENAPERIEIKTALFERLDSLAPAHCIIASSASALVASRFTEDLPGRARCVIGHPVNPPHVIPVVEICGAPWTDRDVIRRATEIYQSVGQETVEIKKEINGFVLNRMQAVLLAEAFRLVGEGYVSAEDLDKTIKHGLGRRWSFMGPMETIELNAPQGIADYCNRYSEMLFGLSNTPVEAEIWGEENCQRVANSWGAAPTQEFVTQKSVWRDDRLAALAAYLKKQGAYTAPRSAGKGSEE